jgi:DNA polymerase-1
MGAGGLQQYAQSTYGITMTIEQARMFREKFFKAYQGIARWHKAVGENGARETRTISGRRRLWQDTPPITELLNTPIQGTSADITKKALGILPEKIKGLDIKLVGTVHDEILLEAPDNQANQAAEILRTTMIEAGSVFLKIIPIEIEVSIADSWAEK